MRAENGLSRRQLSKALASLAIAKLAEAQSKTVPKVPLQAPDGLKTVYQFTRGYACAVSPDSRILCLCMTDRRHETFIISGLPPELRTKRVAARVALVFIELGSFRTLRTVALRAMPASVSFFSDAERVFVQTLVFDSPEGLVEQQAIIDVTTDGKTEERLVRLDPGSRSQFFTALRPGVLLASTVDEQRRILTLRLVATATHEVLQQVPFAVIAEPDQRPPDTDAIVSADRQTITYSTGRVIVRRRSSDLELAWTRTVPARFYGVDRISVSASGDLVAASVFGFVGNKRIEAVMMYRGEDGSEIGQLPLSTGDEGFAVSSSDGRMLALGTKASTPSHVRLGVSLLDLQSGQEIEHCRQDVFRHRSHGEWLDSYVAPLFSPDGRYLVGSSAITNVWQLRRTG